MAASVAHEIRNPLGGIQGYASLLYRDLAELPAKQKMVEPILEGAKALQPSGRARPRLFEAS